MLELVVSHRKSGSREFFYPPPSDMGHECLLLDARQLPMSLAFCSLPLAAHDSSGAHYPACPTLLKIASYQSDKHQISIYDLVEYESMAGGLGI